VFVLRRSPVTALLIAPGAALAVLAFDSGGYYPRPTAVAALVALGTVAAWTLLAPNSLAAFGRSAAVVFALLAGFAGWTLLSGIWSHAPGVALIEFDRALLYLAVFTVFALVGRTGGRARALVAILAGASLLVALVGLAAWLLPDELHVSNSFIRSRMSYPTGYWNTTGLLAGLGVVWSLHLASASREHWALRVAGAAAIAPLVAVLNLTASRGAVVATAAGVIVYVLVTRSRGIMAGLLACVPAGVASFVIVSRRSGLATSRPTPEAIAHGHHLALALVFCAIAAAVLRALLIVLDRKLAGIDFPVASRRTRLQAVAATLVLILAAGVAVDLPGRISHAYRQFSDGPVVGESGQGRLTSLSSDGRTELWHIALKYGFDPDPLLGSGAGTFATLWQRYRPIPEDLLVAHSLYIGTLGDLGLVGAGLLVAALLAIVRALSRHARTRDREGAAWAGLLGGAAAWMVFAAVDWNWQMPACTVWLLAVGGLALSRKLDARRNEPTTRRRLGVTWAVRVAIAGVAVTLALVPLALEQSQRSLDRAIVDLQRDDCTAAQSQATTSREAVPQRSEPFMILAYCAERQRHDRAALEYATAAVHRDPNNWEVHYAQAVVQAASGKQPRAALRAALLRNPRGRYVIEAWIGLDRAHPETRRRAALTLPLPLAMEWCGGPTQAYGAVHCGNPALPTLGAGPPVSPRLSDLGVP
jgi:hypothetical protein